MHPSEFCPISGDLSELGKPNLAWSSLIKCYWILQNARVTAFTVSELLRENQQWVKLPPSPQIKVKIGDIDVNKVLVSKKEPYDTKKLVKYLIGNDDDDVIRPLCIKLPQMIVYVKCFDSNETKSLKVSDKKLLKKYTRIWGRVSSLIGKELDVEPVYGDSDKYIKTKIKSCGDTLNINFQGKKVPKENLLYKCLSLIMLDSFIRVNKKYYSQTLLEECKYEIKKNKMENLINDDFDSSSSDEIW